MLLRTLCENATNSCHKVSGSDQSAVMCSGYNSLSLDVLLTSDTRNQSTCDNIKSQLVQ